MRDIRPQLFAPCLAGRQGSKRARWADLPQDEAYKGATTVRGGGYSSGGGGGGGDGGGGGNRRTGIEGMDRLRRGGSVQMRAGG